jgi:hypothetical protein
MTIAIIFGLVIAALFAGAALVALSKKPATFTVKRSLAIKAAPETLFAP